MPLHTERIRYMELKLSLFVECVEGWYGINCSKQCGGHCRDNIVCHHVTGQCDKGCDAGWTGYFCNKGEFGSCSHFPKST